MRRFDSDYINEETEMLSNCSKHWAFDPDCLTPVLRSGSLTLGKPKEKEDADWEVDELNTACKGLGRTQVVGTGDPRNLRGLYSSSFYSSLCLHEVHMMVGAGNEWGRGRK